MGVIIGVFFFWKGGEGRGLGRGRGGVEGEDSRI